MRKFKNLERKILTSIVSFVVMFSLIQLPVQAAGTVTAENLQSLIDNAIPGDIIDLTSLEQTVVNKTYTISKNITLKGSSDEGTYRFALRSMEDIRFEIKDNANLELKNLAIFNTELDKSVVSGKGNVRIINTVIEQSTAGTTVYDLVPTIDLNGDVYVTGDFTEHGTNPTIPYFTSSIIGAPIKASNGAQECKAGTAVQARNVIMNGGTIVGGSSLDSTCESGDGIVASGNVTIKGTRKDSTTGGGQISTVRIRNGGHINGDSNSPLGYPIRFLDNVNTNSRLLIIKDADVLGNEGKIKPSHIYMDENDYAIIDNSKVGWSTKVPLFSNGGYSITNPVETSGSVDTKKEVFSIHVDKGIVSDAKTSVIEGNVTSYYGYKGDKISIEAASPASGMRFKEWTSDNTTFKDAKSAKTTFIMPDSKVEVKATYEAIPLHTHTATGVWSHNETKHWHECTAQDGTIFDEASHIFGEYEISLAPTETTKGSRHKDCVCGYSITEEIPATGENEEKPTITKGNFTFENKSGKDLTIISSGELEKLTGIYVDDKTLDEKHYTLKSGSTILTLKASYLDTLSVGKHTVTFAYKGGANVSTSITVKAKEEAEDPIVPVPPTENPIIPDPIIPDVPKEEPEAPTTPETPATPETPNKTEPVTPETPKATPVTPDKTEPVVKDTASQNTSDSMFFIGLITLCGYAVTMKKKETNK